METELSYIDSFFNNELSNEEQMEFELKCQTDPTFAENVAFYVKTKYGLKKTLNETRKNEFEELRKSTNSPIIKFQKSHIWLAAASIILFFSFTWWFLSKPNLENFADNYIEEHFASLSSTMSGEATILQEGINAYNNGNYKKSIEIFESKDLENNPISIEFSGIAHLKSNNFDEALKKFERLEKMNLKSNFGTFYHAIALIKRNKEGDLNEAKRLLKIVKEQKLDGWQEIEKLNY